MNEQQAKQAVIKAGLDLVESGLIARTWGNVSCRIDEDRFAITPSGRPYEGLNLDDIVICKTADASWKGDIKPSSEKGVHALIYRADKTVGFIIHTHQKAASAAASSELNKISDVKMGDIPVAAYGLPGTKKLMHGVEAVLAQARGAILMSHHGAVCYGKTREQAFAAALSLEQACERFIYADGEYGDKQGPDIKESKNIPLPERYIYQLTGYTLPAQNVTMDIKTSRREGAGFAAFTPEGEFSYQTMESVMPDEARIHAAIYKMRPDINHIELSADENAVAASYARKPLPQLLDDFAQMMGKPMHIARDLSPESIVKALGKTSAVLIAGAGALCCAATQTDAHALRLVTEKNALAEICAAVRGISKPINPFECRLMHRVYVKSYSKRASTPAGL